MSADKGKAGTALIGASIGFAAGMGIVWQGCAHGQSFTSTGFVVGCMGGGLFAMLGAILGALLG